MGKRLAVPAELEHLIEKRDNDDDRRGKKRRGADRRGGDDLGPLGAIESAKSLDDVPTSDRRSKQRRKASERRRTRRRKSER